MVVTVTSLSIVVLTAVKKGGGGVSVCDRMNGEEKRGGEGPIPVR